MISSLVPFKGGHRLRRRGEAGGESGEQDGDSLVQFGYAVVVGKDRGQGAEAGKVLRRQPVQAQAEKGFIFVRVHDELLQFVEDVAAQVPVVGAVDMEGVS